MMLTSIIITREFRVIFKKKNAVESAWCCLYCTWLENNTEFSCYYNTGQHHMGAKKVVRSHVLICSNSPNLYKTMANTLIINNYGKSPKKVDLGANKGFFITTTQAIGPHFCTEVSWQWDLCTELLFINGTCTIHTSQYNNKTWCFNLYRSSSSVLHYWFDMLDSWHSYCTHIYLLRESFVEIMGKAGLQTSHKRTI